MNTVEVRCMLEARPYQSTLAENDLLVTAKMASAMAKPIRV